MFQVALVDLRKDSPTLGARNTLYVGTLRPWQLLIPPGVGHGYKVIGRGTRRADLSSPTATTTGKTKAAYLYNDPGIGYDWETQHK